MLATRRSHLGVRRNFFSQCVVGPWNLLLTLIVKVQGRTNHSGAHTSVRQGPFSHTRSQDFLWGYFSTGTLLFPQKIDDLLLVVVTFKPTLNVQTFKRQNSVGKFWQFIGAP